MRAFKLLPLALAALLAGCTRGDMTTSAVSDAVAPAGSLMAARDRLEVPQIISVRLAGGRATVTWRPVTDATGYQLVSCDAGSLPTIDKPSGADTVHLFTGLTPGVSYGVKLRARKATGLSKGEANNSLFSHCRTFVGAEAVVSILLSPATAQLMVGESRQMTATLLDRNGAVLTDRDLEWATSNPSVATVSPAGLVAATGAGSADITVTSEGQSASAAVSVRLPGWQLVAPRGAVPAYLTASAYAAGSDAIFAAEMPDFGTGSLWRFDLATHAWTRLTASGWPIGKYRKLIYDSARRRLVTYWDGLGQVFSIPEAGGTWTPDGASGNSDQYYEAYAFHNPVSNRLSVFGGYGLGTFKNTLWEWNGSNAWIPTAVSGPVPLPRFGAQSNVVVDETSSRAFFTQRWLGETPGMGDDLWVLDLRSYVFRNLILHYTGPDARGGSGMAYDLRTRTLYRYGGMTLHGLTVTSDFVRATPDAASVSWSAMPTSASSPGVRYQPGLHYDQARRRLLLVSGFDGATWVGDVWTYQLP